MSAMSAGTPWPVRVPSSERSPEPDIAPKSRVRIPPALFTPSHWPCRAIGKCRKGSPGSSVEREPLLDTRFPQLAEGTADGVAVADLPVEVFADGLLGDAEALGDLALVQLGDEV